MMTWEYLFITYNLAGNTMAKAPTTRPEQHRVCNLVVSQGVERDYQFEHALAAGAIAAPPAKLPASVDLRAAWWDVGDQENTGSCVGWASTDGVARYMFAKANRLAQNAKLSPRFTWMASKSMDTTKPHPVTMIEEAGTSLKGAVEILKNYGAAPEANLPFNINTTMYTGDEIAFYATAATRKIAAYYNLQRILPNWKAWLAAHGPVLVGLQVDHTWDNATATHGLLDNFMPATVRGGHAVTLIGYRSDGRFIVRNSWGTVWGDKGFAYPSENYINAAFFNESYGVTL
ncbi:C1 family peptidase [Rhodoblastus sp.]